MDWKALIKSLKTASAITATIAAIMVVTLGVGFASYFVLGCTLGLGKSTSVAIAVVVSFLSLIFSTLIIAEYARNR